MATVHQVLLLYYCWAVLSGVARAEYCRRLLLSGLDPVRWAGTARREYNLQILHGAISRCTGGGGGHLPVLQQQHGRPGTRPRPSPDLGALTDARAPPGGELARHFPRSVPFSAIIDRWYGYDYWRQGNYIVTTANMQPICTDADEDFYGCTSGHVCPTPPCGRRRRTDVSTCSMIRTPCTTRW